MLSCSAELKLRITFIANTSWNWRKCFQKKLVVWFHFTKSIFLGLKKIMSSTYWLQGVVKCPTRLKKRASNENEDGAYFIIIGHTLGRRGQLATFFSVRFITIFTRLFVQGVLLVKLGLVVNITWFNIFASASVDLKLSVPKWKLCLTKDLMLLRIISQIELSWL